MNLDNSETPIKEIRDQQELLAIIIPRDFVVSGVKFLTPDDFSQQLAYINHPKGKLIQPHFHQSIPREVQTTQEVLYLTKGKLRVDFYDAFRNYLKSHILEAGDLILLIQGGHGFTVLETVEMIEVKQGPYLQEKDKIRFQGVDESQIRIEE